MGCYKPPLTEISSRDLRKEGEHKKMRNDALVMEIRGYRIVEKGIFTVSLTAFPSGHGWQSTLQSPVMLRSSLDPLGLTTSSDILGGEKLSQVPLLRLALSIGVRTSKLKWSLVWWKMIFSWIDWIRWLHEVTWDQNVRAWSESTPSRVLDRLGQYKKHYLSGIVIGKHLWKHNDVAQVRYESGSTPGWEWTICKRYLGKLSDDSNNEEGLSIISFWEAVSFRARI
jgi:hypothetical protein